MISRRCLLLICTLIKQCLSLARLHIDIIEDLGERLTATTVVVGGAVHVGVVYLLWWVVYGGDALAVRLAHVGVAGATATVGELVRG